MAKTIVIDTEVKGVDQAVSDINKIDNAVDKTSSKKISINLDSEKLHHNLKNVEEAGKTIKKVGEGIIGGFSLANGVIGSMGDSIGFTSEEIAEAQEKTEAFFGVMTSIKPVAEGAGAAFKILGGILKTNPLILLATIIGGIIVSFLDMGAIVDGIKKGFSVLGDVASAIFDGIVMGIEVAIGFAAKLFDALTFGLFDASGAYESYTKSVNDATEAERKRIEAEKERIENINKQIEASKKVIEQQEKLRKTYEKSANNIKEQRDLVVNRYDKEIELANAAGANTEHMEMKKLQIIRQSVLDEIAERNKVLAADILIAEERQRILDLERSKNTNSFTNQFNLDLIVANELNKSSKKKVEETKKSLGELQTLFDDTDQSIKVKSAENQKKANDIARANNQLRIQQENEYLDEIARLQEENFESTLSAQAREERAVNDKYFTLEEAAKNNAEELAIVTEAKERELLAITKKYKDAENKLIAEANAIRLQKENEYLDTIATLEEQNFESTLTEQERELRAIDEKYFALEEAAKGNAEQLAIINEAKNKEISDTNKKYRTEEEQQQKQINDFRLKAVQDTLNTLSSLNELFGKKNEANAKKQFQINKAISIASALITTYQSATAAYASQIIPLDPSSVVRGTIAAGLAVAAGLANVAKIASTQFEGGASAAGGGGGGVGGGGASLPTVDTSSTPFQFPTAPENNPQANQQTFVSVTEINNVNNRVQVAEANATFG